MSSDTTTFDTYGATTVISNNGGATVNEVYISISQPTSGQAFTAIDADELRDAIDKAMGLRKGTESPVAKPYRPIDRDRLLRHIEDIEAALTRRNERWEKDQERIRELGALATARGERIAVLEERIEELEAKAAAPSREERLEALEKVGAGQEVVLHPPRRLDTESARARCIPAIGVERVTSYVDGAGKQGFRLCTDDYPAGWYCRAEQVLELGLTAEDFVESAEAKRKKYEDMDLADWEVELLMGAEPARR